MKCKVSVVADHYVNVIYDKYIIVSKEYDIEKGFKNIINKFLYKNIDTTMLKMIEDEILNLFKDIKSCGYLLYESDEYDDFFKNNWSDYKMHKMFDEEDDKYVCNSCENKIGCPFFGSYPCGHK